MSGVNWEDIGPNVLSVLPDPSDAVLEWMNNYCKAYPLNYITQGAAQLLIELRARAK